MKATPIVFMMILAITFSTGFSSERILSIDEQKKLLDSLNADRQAVGEKMGIKFEKLTYSLKLQRELDTEFHCENFDSPTLEEAPLQGDRSTVEYMDEVRRKTGVDEYSRVYFNPKSTEIGCIKKRGCKMNHRDLMGNVNFLGVCSLGPGHSDYPFDPQNTPEKAGMPHLSKYGELWGLGPATSEYAKKAEVDWKNSSAESSGKFFSLTLFLGILAFYF